MKNFKILIFPCGTEIGLELYRSLIYSSHINLIGASSLDDHGKFVYENYIGGLPFIDSPEIIHALNKIVKEYKIDAIYPTLDNIIYKLKNYELQIGCKIISPDVETTEICNSKSKTYTVLHDVVKTPKVYRNTKEVESYPIFLKPDTGYGARNTYKAESLEAADFFLGQKRGKYILTEYLPGDEYTIDCFSNRKRQLLFAGPRKRNRIKNGISVNTSPVNTGLKTFNDIAIAINNTIHLRGAWFFQLKLDRNNQLVLLEIAPRIGGSSSVHRVQGVNFALLSIFDAFDIDVEIFINRHDIEMDRALSCCFHTNLEYKTVYVDLDDCLVIRNRINDELVGFLYRAIDKGKKIVLITKHDGDLNIILQKYRISSLFDQVLHISKDHQKYELINDKSGIFIDDSFTERKEISTRLGIPTFAPDMIGVL